MTVNARRSPLQFLFVAAATQVARRPYIPVSVGAHAALLVLLYYYGSYQTEMREQQAEVASRLHATSLASATKRLQDLQTIKELLERSADRDDDPQLPESAPLAQPETPREMLEQARELSNEIDAIDKEIRAEELAQLIEMPQQPPAPEPQPAVPAPSVEPQSPEVQAQAVGETGDTNSSKQEEVTQELAASEIATLEAKARITLANRQQRLDARANGVQVEGGKLGTGDQTSGGNGGAAAAKGQRSQSSARAEIAEFFGTGDRIDNSMRSKAYSGPFLDFYARGGEIPPADASGMVRGRGRMLGAGGEYANRVYLNTWYIIGPFAGRHWDGLFDNPSYPPEKAVLLDALYYGKDQRLLKWRYVSAQSYPLVPPDQAEDSIHYGYTEVFVDRACDLTAWIGADDDVQIYLNDQLVWEGGNVNKRSYFDAVFTSGTTYLRDYNRTEGKRLLHFNEGRNKVFFKLSNGPNNSYLSMVLTR